MKNNPFVLPGFGQSGPQAENPILASMEMMRRAWEGLASTGGMDASAMGRLMSVEELDKRIADLRAVENWLRMNLSMLGSTIQGLEVQRATLATLSSFMETGMGMSAANAPVRPPADAGGHKPAPAGAARADEEPEDDATAPADAEAQNRAAADTDRQSQASPKPGAEEAGAEFGKMPGQDDIVGAAASAAQGWWNLLQQQFQTLAAATAASAASAQVAGEASGAGAKTPKSAKTTKATKTAKAATTARKATKSTPAKAARKAARKTTR